MKKDIKKHLIIEEDIDTAMEDINANMEKPQNIEKNVELPPVYADAIEQHEETKQHIGKVMKQLQDDANKIIAKNPGTGKKISRKPYTEKLSLDESLFAESYDELPNKDDEIIYTQKDLYLSDEEFQDDFVVEEEIGDKLSDDYGFLHNGFSWKRDGNKIIVSNIDWEIDECLTEKRNNCHDGECEQPNKEKRAQRREQDAKHRDKRKWYDDDLDEAVEDVSEEKVCDKCGKQPCACECEESKLEEAQQPDIFECPICHRNFALGECEHDDSMCQCPRCHSELIKTDNGEYTEYVESVQTDESKQSIDEDFNLTISLYEFEPWTDQAIETWNKLNTEEGALDRLEWELELEYPEGMSESAFNDLLRFESDWVLQAAGITEETEDEEEEDK